MSIYRLLWAAIVMLLWTGSTYARDGVGDRPHVCGGITSELRLMRCQNWIGTLQRPDVRGASCCGDGDAFITDNFETLADGSVLAQITADYPEPPPSIDLDDGSVAPPPFSVHRGMKILVPREKQNHAPEDAGNTSGHGVIFLKPANGEVLCWEPPPLT